MKISVVSRKDNWHVQQIEKEAAAFGVDFERVNVDSLTRIGERLNSFGEVVIWRTASLDVGLARAVFMTRLARKRTVINGAIAEQHFVTHKLFQQKMVEPLKTIVSIPTYYFKSLKRLQLAIENGILKFPLVMKANLGARGEKVFLVANMDEVKEKGVSLKDYVFQNFVKNSGDYRVLVLGGVALGVVKRIAKTGDFRNNISQGGQAVNASGFAEARELSEKAVTIASLFGLHFCGVDFIYDEESGDYRFLEVNTVPQWRGFQEATGVVVAKELVKYCVAMGGRGVRDGADLVDEYYKDFVDYLAEDKKFHFLSRYSLWFGDDWSKKKLREMADIFVGVDQAVEKDRLSGIVKRLEDDLAVMASKEATTRRSMYEKYPRVSIINGLLFQWYFAKVFFGRFIGPSLFEFTSIEEIGELREKLLADDEAVRALSTGAINFLYLSSEFLDLPKPSLSELGKLVHISDEKHSVKLAIYLLTHLVINESMFYTKKIEDTTKALAILQEAEKLIERNYFRVSVDMKVEFLVCCKLVGFQSLLERMILEEARRSLSPLGNFLIDKHNDWRNRHTSKFEQAEHRNVLYLMACKPQK